MIIATKNGLTFTFDLTKWYDLSGASDGFDGVNFEGDDIKYGSLVRDSGIQSKTLTFELSLETMKEIHDRYEDLTRGEKT